ncbi:MAG: hypothetical protein OEX02_15120, partial [Cyclobacteriaceae bacterium]|nr:hypothetical protein [Cyclobacteriaceae bacterium]
MKTYIFIIMSFLSLYTTKAQEILWIEDFETEGEGVRYTSSNQFQDGCNDHFRRTDGTDVCISSSTCAGTTTYTNISGSFFWAGEDQNDAGTGDGLNEKSIVFQPLDVAGYTNFTFSGLFGAGNECGNDASSYDDPDYIHVYYQINNGAWVLALAFESESNSTLTNQPLALDTDLDGVGDGAELTATLAEYSFTIPQRADILAIKIETHADADKEEIAFDNFSISGEIFVCTEPGVPVVTASATASCPGAPVTLSVLSGNLNNALYWQWYNSNCGEGATDTGSEIQVFPEATTTYFVRGEGDCSTPGLCTSITIMVSDTIPPLIPSLSDTTLFLSTQCAVQLPDFTAGLSITDNCIDSLSITQNPVPGTSVSDTTEITLTATDVRGNTTTEVMTLYVSDTVPPVITCPEGREVHFDENCTAIVPDLFPLVTIADECSQPTNFTQTPEPGTVITKNTEVIFTVTDFSGNESTCSMLLSALDTIPPVLSCPAEIMLSSGPDCMVAVPDFSTEILVSDNCNTDFILSQSPEAGSMTAQGLEVIITATDASGQSAQCAIALVITDNTNPVISCPDTQIISPYDSLPDYRPQAVITDNCDSPLTITQQPEPGGVFTENTLVTLTVTDSVGNFSTCSFEVAVVTGIERADQQ